MIYFWFARIVVQYPKRADCNNFLLKQGSNLIGTYCNYTEIIKFSQCPWALAYCFLLWTALIFRLEYTTITMF